MFGKKGGSVMLKNADIISVMQQILVKNTENYLSDFEYDKESLLKNIGKKLHYAWITRKCGTWLMNECRVLIKNSAEFTTLQYYKDVDFDYEKPHILAIEVTGEKNGSPVGNMYSLDYKDYCSYVQEHSVPIWGYEAKYTGGTLLEKTVQRIPGTHEKFGTLETVSPVPEDETRLLQEQDELAVLRKKYKNVSPEKFIKVATAVV